MYYGTKAAYLHRYGKSALGVNSQLSLAHALFSAGIDRLLHQRFELLVELLDDACPLLVPLFYVVEILLYECAEGLIQ